MDTQPELTVETNVYAGSFPRFDRPKIIGFIGLENLKFARRIHEDRVHYDLNLHFNKAIHKPEDLDVKLTDLLKFLLQNELRLKLPLQNRLHCARFFCYRGLMTCIACTPYENREPWKIVAILFRGSIYLCARDTEDKIRRKRNMSEKEKLFTSWGYKFEQYILSDKPDIEPNPDVPVDETEEFSLVFTTNLNHHTVVYGAEMDGIRCDKQPVSEQPHKEQSANAIIDYLSTKDFIELKTNRHIQHPNQEKSFRRFKTKKWWCQSFLVGIDSILCGLRNDDGIVEQLKLFSVKELAKMSQVKDITSIISVLIKHLKLEQKFWNPNVCFNFLDNFFTYVKRCLARKIRKEHGEKALNNIQQLPMITMLFEWSPGMPVMVNQNHSGEDDPILPGWFIEHYGNAGHSHSQEQANQQI